MENTTTTMAPYIDSPIAPRNTPSPTSSGSSATIKPLPMLPTYDEVEEQDEQEQQPYHDDPPTPTETHPARYHRASLATRNPPRYHAHVQNAAYRRPYTDEAPPPSDDDDVPLAHLLHQPSYQAPPYQQHQQRTYTPSTSPSPPYPLDAPPSYAIAIRHSHSYHSTLIQHIPSATQQQQRQYYVREPFVVEIDDEESGEQIVRGEEMRHSVEHVVAMFVVASLLLLVAAVLGWLAFGSGVFG